MFALNLVLVVLDFCVYEFVFCLCHLLGVYVEFCLCSVTFFTFFVLFFVILQMFLVVFDIFQIFLFVKSVYIVALILFG